MQHQDCVLASHVCGCGAGAFEAGEEIEESEASPQEEIGNENFCHTTHLSKLPQNHELLSSFSLFCVCFRIATAVLLDDDRLVAYGAFYHKQNKQRRRIGRWSEREAPKQWVEGE